MIKITDFKKVLFVYSGKGGVGKSTFSTNLAYSIANFKVGLFDADFEGPSIANLTRGLNKNRQIMNKLAVCPQQLGGVLVQSIGFFEESTNGVFLTQSMIDGALEQLLLNVDWETTDILIVDLPPGTSSLHRKLLSRLNGYALLVTTPNQLSFSDTQRGIDLLKRFNTPIVGIVENMAFTSCLQCGIKNRLGEGNTIEVLAQPNQLEILGEFPFDSILTSSNQGVPFVIKYPDHSITKYFKKLSKEILNLIG